MNIYQKMLQATQKIEKVAKNLEVGVGKAQYKAVGEADVLKAVKPIEAELGIYSYPVSRQIIETNVFTTTSEYQGQTKEKSNLFMRIETVYRFVNVDEPSEYIDITTYGDGVDSQDKAPGKAMTYGDKYALLKAYKIQTGDDPDKDASQQGTFSTPEKTLSQAQIKRMFALGKAANFDYGTILKHIKEKFNLDDPTLMSKAQYDQVCVGYTKIAEAKR